MGDVAMSVPVIKNLLNQHPNVKVTMVTNPLFAPMFADIERCDFFGVNVKKEFRGLNGLIKLSKAIRNIAPEFMLADLHNVFRTKVIRNILSFYSNGNASIDKGRKEKAKLTAKDNKELKPLASTHERYAQVFASLGFPVKLKLEGSFLPIKPIPEKIRKILVPGKKILGIAPFAQHKEKMYPLDRMVRALKMLEATNQYQFVFFGGGAEEMKQLMIWETMFANSICIPGKLNFREELDLIGNLFSMISMDSANMHLASLFKVPVVSVWGATHPYAGFLGWNQSITKAAQIDLYCRPCSVFGNVPCYRGDHACMNQLPPQLLLEKLVQLP